MAWSELAGWYHDIILQQLYDTQPPFNWIHLKNTATRALTCGTFDRALTNGRCAGVRVSIDEVEACLDSHSAVQASAVACVDSPTGSSLAGKSRVLDLALQRKPSGCFVILGTSRSRCPEVCPSTKLPEGLVFNMFMAIQ